MKSIFKMAAYVVALSIILFAYFFDQRLYVLIAFGGTCILLFCILPGLYKFLFPSVSYRSWLSRIIENISIYLIDTFSHGQKAYPDRN